MVDYNCMADDSGVAFEPDVPAQDDTSAPGDTPDVLDLDAQLDTLFPPVRIKLGGMVHTIVSIDLDTMECIEHLDDDPPLSVASIDRMAAFITNALGVDASWVTNTFDARRILLIGAALAAQLNKAVATGLERFAAGDDASQPSV